MHCGWRDNTLLHGSPNLFLEGRCPAEFSSNPNQTPLNQLNKVLLGILETSRQVCWGKLELNSAGHRPSGNECGDPCSNVFNSRTGVSSNSPQSIYIHTHVHIPPTTGALDLAFGSSTDFKYQTVWCLGIVLMSIVSRRVKPHDLPWGAVPYHARLRCSTIASHLEADKTATLTQLLLRKLPLVDLGFPKTQ